MNAILLTLPGAGVTYNVIYLVLIKIILHVAVVLAIIFSLNYFQTKKYFMARNLVQFFRVHDKFK